MAFSERFAEEQQNVQTMPYTLPAGFTQFKDNKAVDQKLVDKALYRREGIRFR